MSGREWAGDWKKTGGGARVAGTGREGEVQREYNVRGRSGRWGGRREMDGAGLEVVGGESGRLGGEVQRGRIRRVGQWRIEEEWGSGCKERAGICESSVRAWSGTTSVGRFFQALLVKFNTSAGNLVKEILLKLNLPDHKSILMDSKEYIKIDME
ncbi:hypothetical protein Tco_1064216, partial [Tanacetum coccineum]